MPIVPLILRGAVTLLKVIGTASTGWVIADWFNTTKRVEEQQAQSEQPQPVSLVQTLKVAFAKNIPFIVAGAIAWMLGTFLYNKFFPSKN